MKVAKTMLLVVGLVVLLSTMAMAAQDTDNDNFWLKIHEIAVIDIFGSVPGFQLMKPAQGGLPPVWDCHGQVENHATWAQYTSIVESGKTRDITAAIVSGIMPAGVHLQIDAAQPVGTGNVGTDDPHRNYFTSDTTAHNAKTLVHNIGSCYTGVGGGSHGAQLSFQFYLDDISQVVKTQPQVQFIVKYMLTDDS